MLLFFFFQKIDRLDRRNVSIYWNIMTTRSHGSARVVGLSYYYHHVYEHVIYCYDDKSRERWWWWWQRRRDNNRRGAFVLRHQPVREDVRHGERTGRADRISRKAARKTLGWERVRKNGREMWLEGEREREKKFRKPVYDKSRIVVTIANAHQSCTVVHSL